MNGVYENIWVSKKVDIVKLRHGVFGVQLAERSRAEYHSEICSLVCPGCKHTRSSRDRRTSQSLAIATKLKQKHSLLKVASYSPLSNQGSYSGSLTGSPVDSLCTSTVGESGSKVTLMKASSSSWTLRRFVGGISGRTRKLDGLWELQASLYWPVAADTPAMCDATSAQARRRASFRKRQIDAARSRDRANLGVSMTCGPNPFQRRPLSSSTATSAHRPRCRPGRPLSLPSPA